MDIRCHGFVVTLDAPNAAILQEVIAFPLVSRAARPYMGPHLHRQSMNRFHLSGECNWEIVSSEIHFRFFSET